MSQTHERIGIRWHQNGIVPTILADDNGHRVADFGSPDELRNRENARLAARLPELVNSLLRLRLEATHYRQSGRGAQFLESAESEAMALLATLGL